MRHHSSFYRVNQVLAVIVLFLLIILPLCLILFKGFVSGEDGTFGEHIQQLGQPCHLKILWNSVILGISVVILCTIIALPLSYIMTKTSLSKHQWLDLDDSIYDTTLYRINGMDANNAEKWAVGTTQPHFLTCDTIFL